MLLYLSSNENLGIFDFLSEEQGMIIKKLSGSFQLKQFVIHDMRSLNHYGFLAIDISCLRDNTEEIIEAIIAFQSMYTSRIIIYLQEEMDQEVLIQRLIEVGIYNIVFADSVDRLKELIKKATGSLGLNKRDLMNLLHQGESKSEIIQPEYHFTKKEVKIAVTGVMNRVGTTTMAMNLCHVLAGIGAKVCYVEANSNGHLKYIIEAIPGMTKDRNSVTYNGICFMDLYGESEESFDFIVYDMGSVEAKVVGAIKNKCDIGVVCATGKPYELDAYERRMQLFDGIEVSRVFSFVHEMEQKSILNQCGEVYFSEYTSSLFDSEKNSDIWMQILNKFIVRNTSGIRRIYE
jgi:hypothetical protein